MCDKRREWLPTISGSEIWSDCPITPTFEAIVEGEDRVYVPLLDQTYPS